MNDTEFLFELSRVEGKLMSYAMALTQYCTDDAQELFQATVVRAYTKRTLFTPGTRFDSWIGRIMKNVYLNECASVQRRGAFPGDGEHSGGFDFVLCSSSIDDFLEFNEVRTLIGRLPPEVALPLRMYAHGYKYCEIAVALNIPMSSVKNRIRAARVYLKRLLDE